MLVKNSFNTTYGTVPHELLIKLQIEVSNRGNFFLLSITLENKQKTSYLIYKNFLASPETSFLFAIYSAGLAHSIAIVCSRGLIENCMCHSTKNKVYKLTEKEIIYEDTSCASNSIVYGITESRKMLRNDKESDPRWKIDEHNKEAGRLVRFFALWLKKKNHL